MPTGYTEAVGSGEITDFREYALRCARAFGATILMRDDPIDAEIPEFEPSTFYRDNLEQAKTELAEFTSMTTAQRKALHQKEQDERERSARREIARVQDIRGRYETMLEQARKFVPPTAEHEGLATFMVEQLEESIGFDCGTEYYPDQLEPQPFEQWETDRLETLRDRIGRYAKEWADEQARTDGRNRWVRQLRESLTPEAAGNE